jgi:hypothetical protein
MQNVVFSKEYSKNTDILCVIGREIKEQKLKKDSLKVIYFTFIEADLGDNLVQGSAQGSLRLSIHV